MPSGESCTFNIAFRPIYGGVRNELFQVFINPPAGTETVRLSGTGILFDMSAVKLSVSIPKALAGFVEIYRKKRGLKSRSQVFEEAVKLLRSRELEDAYRQADKHPDKAWEKTLSDRLGDEHK